MMKRSHQETSVEEASSMAEISKKLEDVCGGDDNMDELLAALGYKVRSSDMAEVAQKLEQLEMVLSNDDDLVASSDALNDTVHYNPSDLSGWTQSMLSELNYYQPLSPDLYPTWFYLEFHLRPISDDDESCCSSNSISKMIRLGTSSCDSVSSESTRPVVVVVDSQETGVRLVQALVACADAVEQEDLSLADALVKHVGSLAASQAGAMGKVATYFAEALARRIYRIHPSSAAFDPSFEDILQSGGERRKPNACVADETAHRCIGVETRGGLATIKDYVIKRRKT